MTPERYKQIGKLYHEALTLLPVERAAFLNRACNGNDDLRREVELLLASEVQAEQFLSDGAMQFAAKMLADGRRLAKTGTTIGHYQILSLLGAGGMGEVYLARDGKLGRAAGER
jgi:serine/threonine-protein kinase